MLDGISISGYRSFGVEPVYIGNLAKVNLFIGKNNCGKSNILRAVEKLEAIAGVIRAGGRGDTLWSREIDLCLNGGMECVEVGIQLRKDGFSSEDYALFLKRVNRHDRPLEGSLESDIWLDFRLHSECKPTKKSVDRLADSLRQLGDWRRIIELSVDSFGGGVEGEKAYTHFAEKLHSAVPLHFKTRLVSAFRQVSNDDSDPMSGGQLIQRLQALKHPDHRQWDAGKSKFEKIQDFVRTVLNDRMIDLEIPADASDLYVVIRKKVLPLTSLGTGIHQMVILATAVTLESKTIFCLEEPEIHCHPELQKQFIRFILENTDNQYFIASHSNAFFDLPGINIYSCGLDETSGNTECKLALQASDKYPILQDLGYRASDLLQSNFIVWVEGPSERIYLNYWIASIDPRLVEGLHYSIMFYGGSLRKHLTYELDPDLIKLACLNRNACMVFDSDKKSANDAINDTKQRLADEFSKESLMVWMTAGRTIENYLQEEEFNQSVAEIHPKSSTPKTWRQFSDLTMLKPKSPIRKVDVARKLVELYKQPNLGQLDLHAKVTELVRRIWRCSGLEERTPV